MPLHRTIVVRLWKISSVLCMRAVKRHERRAPRRFKPSIDYVVANPALAGRASPSRNSRRPTPRSPRRGRGSTGHWPVPSGDPPDGMAGRVQIQIPPTMLWFVSLFRSAGSPTNAGGSPALPGDRPQRPGRRRQAVAHRHRSLWRLRSKKECETTSLTLALSPRRGNEVFPSPDYRFLNDRTTNPVAGFRMRRRTILLLPGLSRRSTAKAEGEGRDEGGRFNHFLIVVRAQLFPASPDTFSLCSHALLQLIPLARCGRWG